MDDILFFDATLRDGSHAIKHQLTLDSVEEYCREIDDAGLYTVIIGHGNGLGASSLQIGMSLNSDHDLLTTARKNLKKTKLGAYLIPGYGTVRDNIIPAIEDGVDLFKIGCHCSEADTTAEHIHFLRNQGKEVYGVLMMTHMLEPLDLLLEVKKMESYGAQGVILMDSAGALLPDDVKARIQTIVDNVDILIGFHAHNNMGLAIMNSLVAIDNGAKIIDSTLRGFGAGAGNCQLETLITVLEKMHRSQKIDLYRLMDISENIVAVKLQQKPQEITAISLMSGYSGVFSAFAEPVKKAAKEFNVNMRDIFIELGKRKVVAGQEDMIVDVAMNIAQRDKNQMSNDMIASLL